MKVVFDTNVYVAEALGGETATAILAATCRASWRIFVSQYILDELTTVMIEDLALPRRSATLAVIRVVRRARTIEPIPSRHGVREDPADSEILRTGLRAGADIIVTNDRHLLALDPYEGIQVASMAAYRRILEERGLLR
ncbi:MAG: putative toxin-antitoxin system toxin component, PIN family [Phycisphaerales bacterium]|nr:putative toxin-antitoxin system toxin component, PIN family [Phycisphaerales bacterium]